MKPVYLDSVVSYTSWFFPTPYIADYHFSLFCKKTMIMWLVVYSCFTPLEKISWIGEIEMPWTFWRLILISIFDKWLQQKFTLFDGGWLDFRPFDSWRITPLRSSFMFCSHVEVWICFWFSDSLPPTSCAWAAVCFLFLYAQLSPTPPLKCIK